MNTPKGYLGALPGNTIVKIVFEKLKFEHITSLVKDF